MLDLQAKAQHNFGQESAKPQTFTPRRDDRWIQTPASSA
jgi:hypothetical protein